MRLGVPALFGARPDVGGIFGSQFGNSGYNLVVQHLAAGTWDIVVFVHSSVSNAFEVALFYAGLWAILGWQASASDIWRVEGEPKVVAQEIQFTNGDARLTGTVYLPESGDHLPAVVALH